MIALLLRLYPARWRARYGDEVAALLEERPLGPLDVADLMLGALDAHLRLSASRPESSHHPIIPAPLRLGGWAAIIGGPAWFSGLAWAQLAPDGPGPLLVLGGTISLLVGLTGLSAFQARRYPRLTWAAFTMPAIGAVVSAVGLIGNATTGDAAVLGTVSGWYLWFGGSLGLVAGSGLFAVATWRVGVLSRPASALLGTGCIAIVTAVTSAFVGPEELAQRLLVGSLVTFAGGWVALGLSAVSAHAGAAAEALS